MIRLSFLFKRFQFKMAWAMILSMFFVLSLCNLLVYKFSADAQFNDIREKLMMLAQTAVLMVDSNTLLTVPLNREGVNSTPYQIILEKLKEIKKVNPQIKYIYTMIKTQQEGIWQFVVDPDPVIQGGRFGEPTSFPGDQYRADRFPEMMKAFDGPSADKKLEIDEWGVTLSGYAPIRDSQGKAMAMLGVDILADNIYAMQKEVQKRVLFVLFIAGILSLVLSMLISKRITEPVEKLVEGTRHIASGNLKYQVKIKGDDEISELANAFNQMAQSLDESRRKLMSYLYAVVRTLVRILEVRDHYTRGHSEAVSIYAGKIAVRMGFPPERIKLFKRMTLLHDIGKLGIKDAILHKKDKLTEEEWIIIRQHTIIGENILKPVLGREELLAVVRGHHERYDGQGYPDKLSREQISIFAAIVAVADAYHAMTSNRAYRPALSKEKAIDELRKNRGSQFHPQIVDVFLQILEEEE